MDESYMFAVKNVLEKNSPKQAMKILGADAYLDFKNYEKRFDEEIERYEKYYFLANFEDLDSIDVKGYISTLKPKSRIRKRFIASRVYHEHFMEDPDALFSEFDEDDSVYDLAADLAEDEGSVKSNKFYLQRALCDVLYFCSHNEAYSYVGPDALLEAWELNNKIKKLDLDEFYDVAIGYVDFKGVSTENERESRLVKAIKNQEIDDLKEMLVASKIQEKYFSLSEFENVLKNRNPEYADSEDETGEED